MSVVGLVSAVTGFVKVRYLQDKEVIDNLIFRAHYRMTTLLFFVGCIFVTATGLIGEPIRCLTDSSIPAEVINTYCWVTHTFTWVTKDPNHIHSGVGPLGPGHENGTMHHAYYQWVPFMLFFHGLSFYFPHWIWKNFEGGKIKMISNGIRGISIADNDEKKSKKNQVVNYMIETLHMHEKYAYAYFFCEFLNFVNIIMTMYLIDVFLNNTFMEYGTEVIKFAFEDQEQRTDPMIEVFPRMTKCTFRTYGASGTVQTHDALCILALNILNEKIYIFFWFWLLFLAILTGISVAYSLALLTMPLFRQMIIIKRFKFGSKRNVNRLIRRMNIGDFLLLHLLGQNLNSITFHELLYDLNDKLVPAQDINHTQTLELDPYYPNDKLESAKLKLNDSEA